ncbi:conserved hypothetical protein [delta proteobacterium NaphS2]|nr:conserved hypothetical protein [delta proteobacterium NaphS2]
MDMKFYDAHIHFCYTCHTDHLTHIFMQLKEIGIKGFDAFFMAEFPPEITPILEMIPGDYHDGITLNTLSNQKDPFPLIGKATDLEIVPYLDARFIETGIEQKIQMYRAAGFKGLKLLYVPEEDSGLKISGMQKAFGRTPKQSERITSLLIDNASIQEMFITIHADLRKYGQFIENMIKEHPMTNFNICHFGFSRKAVSTLLDKYPNCFTDLSSLGPFMAKSPSSYLDFIKHYQDKVLFGSDALVGRPENVESSSRFFGGRLDDPELIEKVFSRNYLAFHKRAIGREEI